MLPEATLKRWRIAVSTLVGSTSPHGAEFDLCRAVVSGPSPNPERRQALRALLEGAMADATTPIALVQEVMAVLRAVDRGELDLLDILPSG